MRRTAVLAALALACSPLPAFSEPKGALPPGVLRALSGAADTWLPALRAEAGSGSPARRDAAGLALLVLAATPAELESYRAELSAAIGRDSLGALETASTNLRRLSRDVPALAEDLRAARQDPALPALSRVAEAAASFRAAAPAESLAAAGRPFDGEGARPAAAEPEAAPVSSRGRASASGLRSASARARVRDLGLAVGRGTPGPLNAITDVAGVRVGHVTVNRGEAPGSPGKGPARTGVTAVLPHGGDLWKDKVPAAGWVINGAGEVTGLTWLNEQGALEVPILLTNTMNVGRVMDGVVSWMLKTHPALGVSDDVVIPVVGECDDSTLNDARGRHVKASDAVRAIETAKGGPVAEGAVGAGAGMISFEFKAGIGTASRVLPREAGGYTVGVLVNNNVGLSREDLLFAGAPVGREIADLRVEEHPAEGSIIIVIATDAPLDHLRLRRLASKAVLGMARTGMTSRHGSGDIALAFSTGNRIPHQAAGETIPLSVVPNERLTPLFEAAEEAVEEAILNSLTAAVTTVGRNGNTAHAIPLDRLKRVLRKHRKTSGR